MTSWCFLPNAYAEDDDLTPPLTIIAADWAKDARKRSAFISNLGTRQVGRLEFDGELAGLLEYASSLTGPVLLGIDAALGVPTGFWSRLHDGNAHPGRSFVDFLFDPALPGAFFEPVQRAGDWCPQRPFIRPPPGRWSLKAFDDASGQGLRRLVDKQLNANSMFVTSGIPGSVGSGTRALWQDLITAHARLDFRIWPFQGGLDALLKENVPVIAEIYPKACYGIALAESLPARLIAVAKTREAARQRCLAELQAATWLRETSLTLADLQRAMSNEDDFDALLSAAALTRLFLESAPLESAEMVEPVVEGGILGAASLKLP